MQTDRQHCQALKVSRQSKRLKGVLSLELSTQKKERQTVKIALASWQEEGERRLPFAEIGELILPVRQVVYGALQTLPPLSM